MLCSLALQNNTYSKIQVPISRVTVHVATPSTQLAGNVVNQAVRRIVGLPRRSTADAVRSLERFQCALETPGEVWHSLLKLAGSHPETPQRKNYKIANTQLPSGGVLSDFCCLINGATQLDRSMKFPVLLSN